jgi:hypothetical protein
VKRILFISSYWRSVCTKYRDYFYIVISVSDYIVAFGKRKPVPISCYT